MAPRGVVPWRRMASKYVAGIKRNRSESGGKHCDADNVHPGKRNRSSMRQQARSGNIGVAAAA